MLENETTWRQVLGPDWQEARAKRDWKGLPQVHDHVARLMTGRTQGEGGHWLNWTRDRHLLPLRQRLGRDLSLVSFGCGPGGIEEAILRHGQWPLERIALREYDTALLAEAERKLAPFPLRKDFATFDFDEPPAVTEEFDVVFFCHAIHHCTDLERFLPYLNRVVSPEGLIVGLDYFGPPRLQMDLEPRRLAEEIFACLPPNLRRNLAGAGEVEDRLRIPTIEAVACWDRTEAPRSADLRSMLFSAFDVLEVLPMGGTLLRTLLADRAGNFMSESDLAILNLLMLIERTMIEARAINSDDLYFVLRRSDRI